MLYYNSNDNDNNQGCAVVARLVALGTLLLRLGNQEILVFAPYLSAWCPGFQGFKDFGHPTTFLRAVSFDNNLVFDWTYQEYLMYHWAFNLCYYSVYTFLLNNTCII